MIGQETFNMFYQLYYFFASLRMVRKTLSHRIALTVGRGLPPFSYVPRHQVSQEVMFSNTGWAGQHAKPQS